MVSLQEAIKLVSEKSKPLSIEKSDIIESLHKVLAEDIKAGFNIPSFDRAAMDGYAIYSQNTINASKQSPVILEVKGEIKAGDTKIPKLQKGTAISIMTGAPLPIGCDCVINKELVKPQEEKIKIFMPVESGRNIAYTAEDVKKGQTIIKKGTLIDSCVFSMLAYLGKSKVKVYKKPVVAILSTGNEIKKPGQPLSKYSVYDSNTYTFYSLTLKNGGIPKILGIASDEHASLDKFIKKGLGHDILLLSGGISAGKYDWVADVLMKNGVKMIFWKIAMKPGKPIFFGIKGKTLVFGLGGYPLAAYIGFLTIVKPALQKISGIQHDTDITIPAYFKGNIENKTDKDNVILVKLIEEKDKITAIPSVQEDSCPSHYSQRSSLLSLTLKSNGLFFLKKGETKKEGDIILVHLLEK
ncbi:MAG: molybdopterin molybdotransferase MoeA [Candidatus Omnitrophica bacterium]|jgi:molybdopterin molybdotransferase|nr:molybdopterin molybdotransferase MoeA [Candidatus Omnitrophota bacterium]